MKKIILIIVTALFSCQLSYAQFMKTEEGAFSSDEFFSGKLYYDVDVHMNVDVNDVMEVLRKQDTTGAFTGANAILLKLVAKKLIKSMKLEMFTTYLPDGSHDVYQLIDMENMRKVDFCQTIGRVVIVLPKEDIQYFIFPKLKLGWKQVLGYHNTDHPTALEETFKNWYQKTGVFPFQQIEQINGFDAVTSMIYIEPKYYQGELKDTVTLNGSTYVAVPTSLKTLAECQKGIIVAGEGLDADAAAVLRMYQELIDMEKCSIDPRNFDIPEYIEITEDYEHFIKKLRKAVKKDSFALKADKKVDGLPEVIWDYFEIK